MQRYAEVASPVWGHFGFLAKASGAGRIIRELPEDQKSDGLV